jgi:hypothetical protein
MDTNTKHDQTKQGSMEHTRDSALAQVTVPPTTPGSATEVFEIVSGNRYSTPMAVLTCPQNELASMVLSHLPIKDPTRALYVSKRWQQVILDTVELRQTLLKINALQRHICMGLPHCATTNTTRHLVCRHRRDDVQHHHELSERDVR